MRLVARWGVAAGVSVAGFVLAWWVCEGLIGLDEGASLGIAGAALAMLLAVAAFWAPRGADSGGSHAGSGQRLRQKARARRDAYLAGRDMTIDQRYRDG